MLQRGGGVIRDSDHMVFIARRRPVDLVISSDMTLKYLILSSHQACWKLSRRPNHDKIDDSGIYIADTQNCVSEPLEDHEATVL